MHPLKGTELQRGVGRKERGGARDAAVPEAGRQRALEALWYSKTREHLVEHAEWEEAMRRPPEGASAVERGGGGQMSFRKDTPPIATSTTRPRIRRGVCSKVHTPEVDKAVAACGIRAWV